MGYRFESYQDSVILGLGHPKTGTGFTAHLLDNNGLAIGHEKIKRDGMVSWLACVNRDDAPWNNKNYKDLPSDTKKFLITRSPLDSMVSIFAENKNELSFSWRRKVIFEEFGVDITDPSIGIGDISVAVASLFYWYKLCMIHNPEFVYRVDRVEDDKILSQFVKKNIMRKRRVYKNSHPERHKGFSFDISDVNNLSDTWINNLIEMCLILGYEDDAKKIEDAVDTQL